MEVFKLPPLAVRVSAVTLLLFTDPSGREVEVPTKSNAEAVHAGVGLLDDKLLPALEDETSPWGVELANELLKLVVTEPALPLLD